MLEWLPTRTVLSALVVSGLLCSAGLAQRQATGNADRDMDAQRKREHSRDLDTDVELVFREPLVVSKGTDSFVIPVSNAIYGKRSYALGIPFLLVIERESMIVLDCPLIVLDPNAPILAVRIPSGVISIRTLHMRCAPTGKTQGSSFTNICGKMRLTIEDSRTEKSHDFDFANGRVFVIAVEKGQKIATIRQAAVPLPNLAGSVLMDCDKNSIGRIQTVVALWWEKVKHSKVIATSQVEPRTGKTPVSKGAAVPHRQPEMPPFIIKRLFSDGTPEANYRVFVIAENEEEVLIFPVAKDAEIGLKRSIPFVLAVKHPPNTVAIVTVELFPNYTWTLSGYIDIGSMPSRCGGEIEFELVCSGERHLVDDEFVDTYSEDFSLAETMTEPPTDFDLRKGRVFLVSFDPKSSHPAFKQVCVAVPDPGTFFSTDNATSHARMVVQMASWWNRVKRPDLWRKK